MEEAKKQGEKVYSLEKFKSIERNLPPFPEEIISEEEIEEFGKFG
jgi:hypothetical protein